MEASSRGFRFNGSVGGEEGHAAARQLADQMFERASELSLRWATDTAPELEPEWQEASGLSDTRIVATPQELAQIAEAMEAVLAPYVLRAPADASAGARGVLLLRYVLPWRSGVSETPATNASDGAAAPAVPAPAPLRRNRGFMLFWTGQSISLLGDQVSLLALPLIAVALLHASTFQ